MAHQQEEDRGLTSQVGPIEVDWPRTAGYYGGLAAAVAFGLIEPPLGIFIAAVPFLKMLNRPNSSLPARTVSQFLDGAAKPVGGDSDAVIKAVYGTPKPGQRGLLTSRISEEAGSIWSEAKTVARGRS